jgi:hypothetical protein
MFEVSVSFAARTLPDTSFLATPTATDTLLNTASEKLVSEASTKVSPVSVCVEDNDNLYA